ncbi:MAG: metallo-mystery pair system four-Cys motif protein [Acidobacteria bacterium]|nr:metallo-mystery pair system four-Cys motif protein [Acidobacteriota bacterium]
MNKLPKLLIIATALAAAVFGQKNTPIAISFQAVVGNMPFNCRESYGGIGSTGSTITVSDFRLYVQDVRLVDNNGNETPVRFANDGKFQTERVAMLDFENGEGNCSSGTKEINKSIRGEVPKRKYKGLKLIIGVPEDLNHLDPTLQPSPLNISKMMWSWQMGYKFARIDMRTTGRPNGYVLHLGSTNCATDAASGKTSCGNANRPEFLFEFFDVSKDSVMVDLKALFAGANVDVNKEKTAAGCMSFEGDSDCLPVFRNLGLSFEGSSTGKQSFMRAGREKGVESE